MGVAIDPGQAQQQLMSLDADGDAVIEFSEFCQLLGVKGAESIGMTQSGGCRKDDREESIGSDEEKTRWEGWDGM
jgi:hypothetical protein